MVLNCDCEPRMYPAELVTIERVKEELKQEFPLPEKITNDNELKYKDLTDVVYDITPMYNSKNLNYHILQSLSYDRNKYLKCHWDNYSRNYSPNTSIKIHALKLPIKSEDFYFRFNTVREKPINDCRPLRKILNGSILKRMPIPTDPSPIKKYEEKTKRGYATDDFLKRHTKPFQGLKKTDKSMKKYDGWCCTK